jgi:hypothetical protein
MKPIFMVVTVIVVSIAATLYGDRDVIRARVYAILSGAEPSGAHGLTAAPTPPEPATFAAIAAPGGEVPMAAWVIACLGGLLLLVGMGMLVQSNRVLAASASTARTTHREALEALQDAAWMLVGAGRLHSPDTPNHIRGIAAATAQPVVRARVEVAAHTVGSRDVEAGFQAATMAMLDAVDRVRRPSACGRPDDHLVTAVERLSTLLRPQSATHGSAALLGALYALLLDERGAAGAEPREVAEPEQVERRELFALARCFARVHQATDNETLRHVLRAGCLDVLERAVQSLTA